ncbi:MAG TPA: molybdopterin molybdenumtransferase MoeA, partial [Actinomycetota bacterium]|nr:molybdopterin molybdenumtransferase MoeA [Actinomycetota bacterium]
MAYQMRTVAEVRKDILDAVNPLEPVTVPLLDAWGCVLVEDVQAAYDIPTFASSAMDGFAVRSQDLAAGGDSGVTLKRVGSAFIGKTPDAEVGP